MGDNGKKNKDKSQKQKIDKTATNDKEERKEGTQKNLLTLGMAMCPPHSQGYHHHIPGNIEQALRAIGGGDLRRSVASINRSRFHDPLVEGDQETQTVGCRKYSPGACGNNNLVGRCAFTREDGMCLRPSKSWKKQYAKLRLSVKTVGNWG